MHDPCAYKEESTTKQLPEEVIHTVCRFHGEYGWRPSMVRELINRLYDIDIATRDIEQICIEHRAAVQP